MSRLRGDARFALAEAQARNLFQYYTRSSYAAHLGSAGLRTVRGRTVYVCASAQCVVVRLQCQAVTSEICPDEDLPSSEIELLLTHANYGCMSLICSAANRRHPFIFMSMPSRFGALRLPRLLS